MAEKLIPGSDQRAFWEVLRDAKHAGAWLSVPEIARKCSLSATVVRRLLAELAACRPPLVQKWVQTRLDKPSIAVFILTRAGRHAYDEMR